MSGPIGADARLTMHVLDVSVGHPAAGLATALLRVDGDRLEPVAEVVTDADGRTAEPLLAGEAFTPGTYELQCAVGAHFERTQPGTRTFYDTVTVRFRVGPDDGHVHVALLVSPWSYTTYRGS